MHRFLTFALLLGMASCAIAHESAEPPATEPGTPLRAAFDSTMAAADRAIQKYGITDSATRPPCTTITLGASAICSKDENTVRELLLASRNFLSPSVLGHRHDFDTKPGDVTHMPQK